MCFFIDSNVENQNSLSLCLFRTQMLQLNTDVGVRQQSKPPDLPGVSGVRVCVLYLAGQQRTSHVRVQPIPPLIKIITPACSSVWLCVCEYPLPSGLKVH